MKEGEVDIDPENQRLTSELATQNPNPSANQTISRNQAILNSNISSISPLPRSSLPLNQQLQITQIVAT
jgi:hypothetical protein